MCHGFSGADSSLRVFDVENGMMLLAPLEEMECDTLACQGDFIVARCGQGQAMLVLRHREGEEELQEVDFIVLREEEGAQAPQQTHFRMKGGHKV